MKSSFFIVFLFIFTASFSSEKKVFSATAIIKIDAGKPGKKVSLKLGTSMPSLYRANWKKPLDVKNVKNALNEIAPSFICIQNTMLGFPFYAKSTGKPSYRLSVIKTMEKMNISRDLFGKELLKGAKKDFKYYSKPPHKNYDDILQYFETLDAKPEICIRIPTIFTSLLKKYSKLKLSLDPKTGANLVHYLNDKPSTKWGKLRAKNGHPKPYNVKYFILGNELWSNHIEHKLSIRQITSHHIAFYKAMKKADPSIQIGHNLVDDVYPHKFLKPGTKLKYKKLLDYNDNVLKKIAKSLDFVTYHVYSYGIKNKGNSIDILNEKEWSHVLSLNYLKDKYKVAKRHRSIVSKYNKNIKIIIDEFNGPTGTLGGALYNLDYMIYLLNNNYDVFLANWNLGLMETRTTWGLLKLSTKNDSLLAKRPNFYALRLLRGSLGKSLLKVKVKSPNFNASAIKWKRFFNWPEEKNIPSLNALSSIKNGKLYLLVVNRSLDTNIKTKILLENYNFKKRAKVYLLTGENINAHNETKPENVSIKETILAIPEKEINYVFKKHSITVLEF
jgi:alpha-N-arabinofuranosidase